MGKKIPIILSTITALIGSPLLLQQDSSAMYRDDSTTWWTVEELLEFSDQVDQETDLVCGSDIGCRQDRYFNNLESEDGRYMALEHLYQSQFHVTSINPTAETMKVIFFDQDAMLRAMGVEEHDSLNYIFMGWFNEPNINVTNYNPELPDAPQFPEDLHIIYSTDEHPDASYPSNREFTLPINTTGLENNPLGKIYLATYGKHYNSQGSLDYRSCLTDPDYAPGTECSLMFTSDQSERYFPPKNNTEQNETLKQLTADSPDDATEPVVNSLSEANDQSASDTAELSTDGSTTQDSPATAEQDKDSTGQTSEMEATSTDKQEADTVKTPETGSYPSRHDRAVDFPWWLAILLVLGNGTLLRFFSPKKSKKPLTQN